MKINDSQPMITPDVIIRKPILKETAEKAAPVSDRFISGADEFSLDQVKDALACVPKWEQTPPSQRILNDKTVQYADSYGRVKHLAMQLSSYASGETRSQMLNAYKTLFQKMEPDTKFTVVVGSDNDKADVEKVIRDNNISNPERIKFIKPDVGSLTVWARDEMIGMFKPGEESKQALLNQKMLHDWHASDSRVPAYIADQNSNITLDKEPRLVTDGGDTVSNRNDSFVGYYSLAATAKNLQSMAGKSRLMKRQLTKYYENRYSKEVVESGSDDPFSFKFVPRKVPGEIHAIPFTLEKNPDYKTPDLKKGQVDEGQMYEDLAVELFTKQFGKNVTVMGKDDPSTSEMERPATDHMDMGLTPVDEKTFMLGSPGLMERIVRGMNPEEISQANEILSRAAGKKVDLREYTNETRADDSPHDFDAYEKKLTDQGYRVVRLPHSEPDWWGPYITYNNCLMERFDKNGDGTEYRRVFLPVYGIDKLDNYAIQAYEKEGFEVIPMRLDALSARWGALRCTTNWLERSPQG